MKKKTGNYLNIKKYLEKALPAVFVLSWFTACVSINEKFLIDNINNEAKSKIITERGIALYNKHLINNEEYQKLGEVNRYFEVALAFDPDNKAAGLYLSKIKSFVKEKVTEKLKIAKNIQLKKNRNEADNFNMCYAISVAYSLNPQDEEVNKLRRDTMTIRSGIVRSYLENGKHTEQDAEKSDSDDIKVKKYLQNLDYYNKGLKLAPEDAGLKNEKEKTIAALVILFDNKYASTGNKLNQKKFGEAESLLKSLQNFNNKIDSTYDDKISKLAYQLYYEWAKAYFNQANYPLADVKIRLALSAYRSREALALRDKIAAILKENNVALSFDDDLKNIDTLLVQQNWEEAYNALQNLTAGVTDAQKLQQIKQRQHKIQEQLPVIYQLGAKYYQEEDYKQAIEVLETVISINPDYEQAANYLAKSRMKQKILENGY